jgi:hypothetical protein
VEDIINGIETNYILLGMNPKKYLIIILSKTVKSLDLVGVEHKQ